MLIFGQCSHMNNIRNLNLVITFYSAIFVHTRHKVMVKDSDLHDILWIMHKHKDHDLLFTSTCIFNAVCWAEAHSDMIKIETIINSICTKFVIFQSKFGHFYAKFKYFPFKFYQLNTNASKPIDRYFLFKFSLSSHNSSFFYNPMKKTFHLHVLITYQ